jgi:AcrR family transcriptional regulator
MPPLIPYPAEDLVAEPAQDPKEALPIGSLEPEPVGYHHWCVVHFPPPAFPVRPWRVCPKRAIHCISLVKTLYGEQVGLDVQGSKRRGRLTPESITKAAIRIADAEGLDAVSIRRVAAELDSRPMSLYSHIANKEELLASMASECIEEMLVQQPLPEDWREAIAEIARLMYATFVAHPWLVLVFMRQPRFGPNATRQAKQMARAVSSLSLEPADIWLLQGTVNDYVLGHSLRATAAPTSTQLAEAVPKVDVVEFPELASLGDSLRSRSSADRFEVGLQIVLDGVERQVTR